MTTVEDGLLGAFGLLLVVVSGVSLAVGAQALGRAARLAIVAGCFAALWFAHHRVVEMTGFPVRAALPEAAVVLGSHVVEPDPAGATTGQIALWLRDESRPDMPPRAYRLPYDRGLHERLHELTTGAARGQDIMARRNPGAGGKPRVRLEMRGQRSLPRKPGAGSPNG